MSVINYNVLKRNLEAEVSQSNLDTLKQTKEAINTILQTTEERAYNLVRYSDVQLFLSRILDLSLYEDIEILKKVMQTAEVYKESSPYINDIYFYSIENNIIVTANSGIYPKMTNPDMQSMKLLADRDKGTMWIAPFELGVFSEKTEDVQLIKFLYKGKGEINDFALQRLEICINCSC